MQRTSHILIVDDDAEIRDLVARFLRKHEIRVETAADGRAMSKLMERARFDLVVLDLMLPGEDGLSLCRRLRVETTIPVIMLTALGEETDRIIGLEMGADDYLAKPFNPRELLARIKAAGVIPTPFYTYIHYHGNKWVEYGEEKMQSMFAHRWFLDEGIPVAGASDYVPGPYEPLMAIQSLVTRKDTEGRVWGPQPAHHRR